MRAIISVVIFLIIMASYIFALLVMLMGDLEIAMFALWHGLFWVGLSILDTIERKLK